MDNLNLVSNEDFAMQSSSPLYLPIMDIEFIFKEWLKPNVSVNNDIYLRKWRKILLDNNLLTHENQNLILTHIFQKSSDYSTKEDYYSRRADFNCALHMLDFLRGPEEKIEPALFKNIVENIICWEEQRFLNFVHILEFFKKLNLPLFKMSSFFLQAQIDFDPLNYQFLQVVNSIQQADPNLKIFGPLFSTEEQMKKFINEMPYEEPERFIDFFSKYELLNSKNIKSFLRLISYKNLNETTIDEVFNLNHDLDDKEPTIADKKWMKEIVEMFLKYPFRVQSFINMMTTHKKELWEKESFRSLNLLAYAFPAYLNKKLAISEIGLMLIAANQKNTHLILQRAQYINEIANEVNKLVIQPFLSTRVYPENSQEIIYNIINKVDKRKVFYLQGIVMGILPKLPNDMYALIAEFLSVESRILISLNHHVENTVNQHINAKLNLINLDQKIIPVDQENKSNNLVMFNPKRRKREEASIDLPLTLQVPILESELSLLLILQRATKKATKIDNVDSTVITLIDQDMDENRIQKRINSFCQRQLNKSLLIPRAYLTDNSKEIQIKNISLNQLNAILQQIPDMINSINQYTSLGLNYRLFTRSSESPPKNLSSFNEARSKKRKNSSKVN